MRVFGIGLAGATAAATVALLAGTGVSYAEPAGGSAAAGAAQLEQLVVSAGQ